MGLPPIAGWFIRNDPTKMDDDWGYSYDVGNHQMTSVVNESLIRCSSFGYALIIFWN